MIDASRAARRASSIRASAAADRAAARKPTARGTALLFGALITAACAGPAPLAPPLEAGAGAAPGELRIRLEFGAEADLDLYATDPFGEAVYFANTPSRASGGALERDRRCGDPAPRVEVVRFAPAPPGRYRVGVDFAERCEGARAAVPFRVVAEAGGGVRTREGSIAPGELLPSVLELELGLGAAPGRPERSTPAGTP